MEYTSWMDSFIVKQSDFIEKLSKKKVKDIIPKLLIGDGFVFEFG